MELGLDKVVKKFLLEIVIIVEFAWDRNRKEYSMAGSSPPLL